MQSLNWCHTHFLSVEVNETSKTSACVYVPWVISVDSEFLDFKFFLLLKFLYI